MNTYLHWLRTTNPSSLTTKERKTLQEDLDWAADNPKLAKALDAFKGMTLTLSRERKAFDNYVYPCGTQVHVMDRWKTYLYGYVGQDRNLLVSVNPAWLDLQSAFPTPKPRFKSAAEQHRWERANGAVSESNDYPDSYRSFMPNHRALTGPIVWSRFRDVIDQI